MEKCCKLESLFVFGNDEELTEHLKVCPDCRQEFKQMENISSMVKEVAPFIQKKVPNNHIMLKVAAGLTVIFLSFWILQAGSFFVNKNSDPALAMVKSESQAAQIGLPTDEYGLLVVEN